MFEMFYNMDDGRERLQHIINLRKQPQILPEDFSEPFAVSIIQKLTLHSPDKRCSAGDILSDSSQMPIQSHLLIESDEKVRNVREVTRAACQNPNSRSMDAIMTEIFQSPGMTPLEQNLFDVDECVFLKDLKDINRENRMILMLNSIFHQRGYEHLECPLLSPSGREGDERKVEESTVKLLDNRLVKI